MTKEQLETANFIQKRISDAEEQARNARFFYNKFDTLIVFPEYMEHVKEMLKKIEEAKPKIIERLNKKLEEL